MYVECVLIALEAACVKGGQICPVTECDCLVLDCPCCVSDGEVNPYESLPYYSCNYSMTQFCKSKKEDVIYNYNNFNITGRDFSLDDTFIITCRAIFKSCIVLTLIANSTLNKYEFKLYNLKYIYLVCYSHNFINFLLFRK